MSNQWGTRRKGPKHEAQIYPPNHQVGMRKVFENVNAEDNVTKNDDREKYDDIKDGMKHKDKRNEMKKSNALSEKDVTDVTKSMKKKNDGMEPDDDIIFILRQLWLT